MYLLPRVVVENQEDTRIEGGEINQGTGSGISRQELDPVGVHDTEIPAVDLDVINGLRDHIRINNPDQVLYADSLSKIFISYHQYDSAAKYLEIIAEFEPGLDAYERAGTAYYNAQGFAMNKELAGRYGEKARYYYSLVLEENNERMDIRNNVAMTYISSDNPMQGITLLRQILEEDADNETALFNMGILAIQSGQYERAIERFKNLVSLYPQNLQGQFYLGFCYYEAGQKDMARRQFELVRSMEDDAEVLATIDGYLKELN